jgi:hypothetical protein
MLKVEITKGYLGFLASAQYGSMTVSSAFGLGDTIQEALQDMEDMYFRMKGIKMNYTWK